MRQSVIGIFEYRRDAIRARDAIQQKGIADVELNVMPADEIGDEGLSDDELGRYEDAIDLLFDEGADASAQLYLDALRRGQTLLTVTVDEGGGPDAMGRVKSLLREHNVSDLSEDAPTAGEATPAEKAQDQAKDG